MLIIPDTFELTELNTPVVVKIALGARAKFKPTPVFKEEMPLLLVVRQQLILTLNGSDRY